MTEITPPQPVRQSDDFESPIWAWILLGGLLLLTIGGVFVFRQGHGSEMWTKALGVIATLGIFSILYKENPLFRFMEHIFIGLATGFGIFYTWTGYLQDRWWNPMLPAMKSNPNGQGHWWLIFTLCIGALFFTVYFPKLSWMNRFVIGVFMGWFAGYAFVAFMGIIGPQLIASFRPPLTTYTVPGAVAANNIAIGSIWFHPWSLISLVVLLCVLAYFFFSLEHKYHFVRTPSIAGRYFLMITLGAIFGTTVMSRFTLLIGRIDFVTKALSSLFHLFVK